MSGMREGVVRIAPRRYRRRRPRWHFAAAVIVAAVVFIGLIFGIVKMFSGSSEPAAVAPTPNPSPCVTVMVSPAESLPVVSQVRVNVFNATSTIGLAGTTADELRARGFDIRTVANEANNRQIQGTGELRYGPTGKAAAQLLAYYFPGVVLIPDDRTRRVVDVVVGSGFVAVVDDATVAAKKASPTPSPSGIGCPTTPLAVPTASSMATS